jgi:aminoglycoside 3-N-acetyltransferase
MNADLKRLIERLPLTKGGVLLVGSDVLGLAVALQEKGERLDLNELIDALQLKIGGDGTLLFPAFNFDFCEGRGFDYRKSQPQTGALSKAAMARPDFKRTQHPIHSFSVWGKHRDALCAMENISSFGLDSPFHFLYENNAQMLIIGIGFQGAFTFAHYVEEREKAPYRYFKDFTGPYADESGKSSVKTYSMFVRASERGIESFLDPIGEVLEKKGIAVMLDFSSVPFRVVDLARAYEEIAKDIRENRGQRLHRQLV